VVEVYEKCMKPHPKRKTYHKSGDMRSFQGKKIVYRHSSGERSDPAEEEKLSGIRDRS